MLHLYQWVVIFVNIYYGYCALADGISNIALLNSYNYFELYFSPAEATCGGDGKPITGLMPGVEDKDSLILESRPIPNPSNPNQSVPLGPRDQAIADCPGHH